MAIATIIMSNKRMISQVENLNLKEGEEITIKVNHSTTAFTTAKEALSRLRFLEQFGLTFSIEGLSITAHNTKVIRARAIREFGTSA